MAPYRYPPYMILNAEVAITSSHFSPYSLADNQCSKLAIGRRGFYETC